MNFHVMTLFPEMIMNGLHTSVIGKAIEKDYIHIDALNIRDYTTDKHKKVDDYTYGGGAGMLMQAQPVFDCYESIQKTIKERTGQKKTRVIYVTPQGETFKQSKAQELAKEEDLIFLCGHYEGIDERALEEIVTDYISIGDYVLTGGELPAMVMIDAIARFVPGVLNNDESAMTESFYNDLLEYPQYSRPEVWQGKKVPEVLLQGNHAKIEAWRLEESEKRTKERRPDLFEKYSYKKDCITWLRKKKNFHMDMIEALQRGLAEIYYFGQDGVLIKTINDAYIMTTKNVEAGQKMLSLFDKNEWNKPRFFVTHQEFMNDIVIDKFGLKFQHCCYQAVYTTKSMLKVPNIEIRLLTESDCKNVTDNYSEGEEFSYIMSRIKSNTMYGVFDDNELAGFIGTHTEGSMGILEVLPSYRRKGYGVALEAYQINQTIKRGETPFCQIDSDNEKSLKLQEKLGLTITKDQLYWFV